LAEGKMLNVVSVPQIFVARKLFISHDRIFTSAS